MYDVTEMIYWYYSYGWVVLWCIYNSWIIFDDLLALLIPQNELSDISRIGSREKKNSNSYADRTRHTLFSERKILFVFHWKDRMLYFWVHDQSAQCFFSSVYLNVISLVVAPKKFNFFPLFSNKNKIFSWRFIGEKKVLIWVCVCLCTCCSMW